jgi:hypothetical protein
MNYLTLWWWRISAVIVLAMLFAIPANATPTNPLCANGAYRAAHPLICDTGLGGPFAPGGGGGIGGGSGGLLGDLLHTLTGGLL